MSPRAHPWVGRALAVSVIYVAIGIVFGALAGAAGPTTARTAWRGAAFLVSGVVYVVHFAVEWKSRRVLASSLHLAAAVAVGAFGLALSANLHSLSIATTNKSLLRMSLLIWPLMTGLPAFVVALAAATLGNRLVPTPLRGDASPNT